MTQVQEAKQVQADEDDDAVVDAFGVVMKIGDIIATENLDGGERIVSQLGQVVALSNSAMAIFRTPDGKLEAFSAGQCEVLKFPADWLENLNPADGPVARPGMRGGCWIDGSGVYDCTLESVNDHGAFVRLDEDAEKHKAGDVVPLEWPAIHIWPAQYMKVIADTEKSMAAMEGGEA